MRASAHCRVTCATPCADPDTPRGHVQLTIVIPTYNRASRLPSSLRAVANQCADIDYEVVVVDNNSTDDTRDVVDSWRRLSGSPVHYIFEPRQGVSYARNTGIAAARGSLVAFTDDDIEVNVDWVMRAHELSCRYPDVGCFGGRVLPRWPSTPPHWLDRRHWSPLALTDHGNVPFTVSAARPQCLIAANLIVRRQTFDRAGLFSPDYPRTQDHEWLLRFWRAGFVGLYHPSLVVWSDVDPDRLARRYHRRWHFEHGKYSARMRLRELIAPSGELYTEAPPTCRRIFGTPRFVFREFGRESLAAVRLAVTGAPRSATLARVDAVYDLAGCIREGASQWWRGLPADHSSSVSGSADAMHAGASRPS
jgi:glycosyltransferase involved in cell wall biosynthesis